MRELRGLESELGVATPPSWSGDLGNASSKFLLESKYSLRETLLLRRRWHLQSFGFEKGRLNLVPIFQSSPLMLPNSHPGGTGNRYGCLLVTKLGPELCDWFPRALLEMGQWRRQDSQEQSLRAKQRGSPDTSGSRSPTANWPWLYLTWVLLNIPFAHTFFI